MGLLAFSFCRQVYPFLALTRPVSPSQLVILEGWLGDAELSKVVGRLGADTKFVTTGGPVSFGYGLMAEKTYAEVTAARLRLLGVSPSSILVVSSDSVTCDRTYAAARAVRRAFEDQDLLGRPANLYSLGAHSRRSFFLYRHALGRDVPLGVIALESEEFDLRHWWRSSLSFKHVMGELMSWIYTLCTSWRY